MPRHPLTAATALLAAIVALTFALSSSSQAHAQDLWPSIDSPPSVAGGGGEQDVVVIVAIEDYYKLSSVPGARANADAWHRWFETTRGTPLDRMILLKDDQATREGIQDAAERAVKMASPEGRLWFIYIGHGAPAKDQQNGVLVGADAQQTAQSLYARSFEQDQLIEILEAGPQSESVVVIDACFSGEGSGGGALVEGLQPIIPVNRTPPAKSTILSAGRSNEFAGPLPGARRPAFSYLVLGALRGWGDENKDGEVTETEVINYANRTLRATLQGRHQTPQRFGASQSSALALKTSEAGPDVGEIARSLSSSPLAGASIMSAPTIQEIPRPRITPETIAAHEAYDRALTEQNSKYSNADRKADAWCNLAAIESNNPYQEIATPACAEWREFANHAAERAALMGQDFDTVIRYLKLKNVPSEEKIKLTREFVTIYGDIKGSKEKKQVQWVKEAEESVEDGDDLPALPRGLTSDASLEQSIPAPQPPWAQLFLGLETRGGLALLQGGDATSLTGFGGSTQVFIGAGLGEFIIGATYGLQYASTSESADATNGQEMSTLYHGIGGFLGVVLDELGSSALLWVSYIVAGDSSFTSTPEGATASSNQALTTTGPVIGFEYLFSAPLGDARIVLGPTIEVLILTHELNGEEFTFSDGTTTTSTDTTADISFIIGITLGVHYAL